MPTSFRIARTAAEPFYYARSGLDQVAAHQRPSGRCNEVGHCLSSVGAQTRPDRRPHWPSVRKVRNTPAPLATTIKILRRQIFLHFTPFKHWQVSCALSLKSSAQIGQIDVTVVARRLAYPQALIESRQHNTALSGATYLFVIIKDPAPQAEAIDTISSGCSNPQWVPFRCPFT